MNRVKAGFFSMSGPATPSYLRWHALDHMPEQYSIPGIVLGQRWVATEACLAARAAASADFAPIRHAVLYLMGEPLGPTIDAFVRLGRTLAEAGRFPERVTSHLLGAYDLVDAVAAPRVLVSAEVVPFRPHRGVYVLVEPADAASCAERALAVDGVAGVWSFVTTDLRTNPMWTPGERRITVSYLDGDPPEVAAAFAPVLAGREPLFAGPFETSVFRV